MKHVVFGAISALFLLTPPAFAETRRERIVEARKYITSQLKSMDLSEVITQMWKPIVTSVESNGQTVSPEQKKKLNDLYQKTFSKPMLIIMHAQDNIMADILSLEEIQYLNKIYSTELGRSVMQKMPEIIGAQQPQIVAMIQETLPAIMPEIQSILAIED